MACGPCPNAPGGKCRRFGTRASTPVHRWPGIVRGYSGASRAEIVPCWRHRLRSVPWSRASSTGQLSWPSVRWNPLERLPAPGLPSERPVSAHVRRRWPKSAGLVWMARPAESCRGRRHSGPTCSMAGSARTSRGHIGVRSAARGKVAVAPCAHSSPEGQSRGGNTRTGPYALPRPPPSSVRLPGASRPDWSARQLKRSGCLVLPALAESVLSDY